MHLSAEKVKRLKKILKIVMWVALVAGAVVLLAFSNMEQSGSRIKRVNVFVAYGQADVLITPAILDTMIRKTKGELKGKSMDFINTAALATLLRNEPYVKKVDVYETNDGYLNIDVVQREPVLRIVNKSQEGFYLDREGYALPLHPEYPAHVLVASGFITDSFLRNPKLKASLPEEGSKPDSLIDRLYMLAMVLSGDTYFRNTFDQIYVNEQKEFELVPKKGNHVVQLGVTDDLEQKLGKLLVFYNKGLNEIGWNKYHVINIKYKNQVICSKL
jgi:cell division protein FtsQ